MSRLASIDHFRSRWAMFAGATRFGGGGSLSFGIAELDSLLVRGALHEIIGEASAVTGFLAALLGRNKRLQPILWVARAANFSAQALAQLGFDHRRLTVVSAHRVDDRLWAAEEGLSELGYGAVIAEVDTADLETTQQLQLAAEKGGATGFLIRRDRQASAAKTRWSVEAMRSDGYRPCWRLSLERSSGIAAGRSWLVEWDYATASFRLVASLSGPAMQAAAA